MTQLFSRWRDTEFDFEGVSLALQLRAVSMLDEGRELQRRVLAWRKGVLEQVDGLRGYLVGSGQQPEDVFDLYERAFGDQWARERFATLVRLKAALSIDDKPVADGKALYEELGLGERVAILMALSDLTYLSSRQGKASPSPSTSSVATTPAPSDGASAATSTDGEGGPRP